MIMKEKNELNNFILKVVMFSLTKKEIIMIIIIMYVLVIVVKNLDMEMFIFE